MIQKRRLRRTLRRRQVASGKEKDQPLPCQERSPGRRPRGRWKRARPKMSRPAATRTIPRMMKMRPSSDMREQLGGGQHGGGFAEQFRGLAGFGEDAYG